MKKANKVWLVACGAVLVVNYQEADWVWFVVIASLALADIIWGD